MRLPTALLISSHESIIEPVRDIVRPIPNLGLDLAFELKEGLARVAEERIVLLLVHLGPGGVITEVVQLLRQIAAAKRPVATLVLSEQHNAEEALALLRLGAADYLSRPLNLARLTYLIDALTVRARYAVTATPGPKEPPVPDQETRTQFFSLPNEPMGQLLEQVLRLAPQDVTLLLTGETGTGKTSLARLIHAQSPRRHEPFVWVSCAALPSNLIESELFGHVKGAFTGADRARVGRFAAVGRGTLLLDEVDALPLSLQAKLLHVVEARTFEPVGSNQPEHFHGRLIAASNCPLEGEVAAGRFRADLFYRLNVVGLYLPPLAERRAVVAPLARRFVGECAARNGRPSPAIAPEVLETLQRYQWPGNIRELRNVIERAFALCSGHEILLQDLPALVGASRPGPAQSSFDHLPALASNVDARFWPPRTLCQAKAETETTRIVAALQKHKNNRLRAAAELGISRMTLYKKLRKYGLMEVT